MLASMMAARADRASISFFAFTATPKGKTLELFDPVEIDPVVDQVIRQGSHNKLYSLVKTSRDRFHN